MVKIICFLQFNNQLENMNYSNKDSQALITQIFCFFLCFMWELYESWKINYSFCFFFLYIFIRNESTVVVASNRREKFSKITKYYLNLVTFSLWWQVDCTFIRNESTVVASSRREKCSNITRYYINLLKFSLRWQVD